MWPFRELRSLRHGLDCVRTRQDAIEAVVMELRGRQTLAENVQPKLEKSRTLYCSFCGKSQHDVRKLIAGPTVFICSECVALCADICINDKLSNDPNT